MLASTSSSPSYALELQALKAELQLTLARLGDVSSRPDTAPSDSEPGVAPWSVTSTRTLPTTDRSTPSLSHAPPAAALDATRAPRGSQHLVRELRLAARRRRELEAELAREQRRATQQAPWQSAIAALRRQRAEIAREMEAACSRELFAGSERGKRVLYRDSATQMSPVPPPPPSRATQAPVAEAAEKQFAIGGVVTLEPLRDGDSTAAPRSAAAQVAAQTQLRTIETGFRPSDSQRQHQRQHNHQHHDALNEVFSIQLKFAETMLKLEKCVQVREQLLQRSTAPPAARGHSARRGRARGSHTGRRLASDAESEDLSSDYDSFSSGTSLGEYAVRLRRYTSDTADDLLESAGRARDAATAPASSRAYAAAVADPPVNQLDQTAAEKDGGASDDRGVRDGAAGASPASNLEPRTPSTENSVKTTSSSEPKKVRFGGDAGEYATPLIVKKFTFENQSDDDDDVDDDRARDGDDGSESALSFMDGSSVASAELNDVSLVKAFEAFRLELGMLKAASPQLFSSRSAPSGISAAISAARKLFADGRTTPGDDDDDRRTVILKPAKPSSTASRATVAGGIKTTAAAAQAPVVVAKVAIAPNSTARSGEQIRGKREQGPPQQQRDGSETDRASLRERRRQLCLDIQDESAQLVLTFGSRNAHETERIKQTLIELRGQLRRIDEQLAQ